MEGWEEACEKAWSEVHAMFALHRSKNPKRCDSYVKQFSLIVDGITHGLVYQTMQPEEGSPAIEWVGLKPCDLVFHPPWDSGEWST